VRELQNVLKQTLALARQPVISVELLPEEIVARATPGSPRKPGGFFDLREERIAAFEKEYLRNLLSNSLGDVTAAAREAQLPRATLYRLLKRRELDPADFRASPSPPA
jgi:DNA-binding NtrC family response regulator